MVCDELSAAFKNMTSQVVSNATYMVNYLARGGVEVLTMRMAQKQFQENLVYTLRGVNCCVHTENEPVRQQIDHSPTRLGRNRKQSAVALPILVCFPLSRGEQVPSYPREVQVSEVDESAVSSNGHIHTLEESETCKAKSSGGHANDQARGERSQ